MRHFFTKKIRAVLIAALLLTAALAVAGSLMGSTPVLLSEEL